MMECDIPSIAVKRLDACGLLDRILPEIYRLKGVKQGIQHFGDVYEHTLSTLDKTHPIALHRLAALFHDCGKPYTRMVKNKMVHFYNHENIGGTLAKMALTNLKFSNAEINKIVIAIREHMRFKQFGDKCPSKKAIRKLIASVTEDNLDITLDLMHADNISHAKNYCMENQIPLVIEELKTLDTKEVEKVPLPIDGKDIMKEFNLKPSPIVGECLKLAEDVYFENPNATKEEYFKYIKNKLTL
jgi:poly(A) polymerase/tRNA nucleotidyltransferase (CCA-adding enzyme)